LEVSKPKDLNSIAKLV